MQAGGRHEAGGLPFAVEGDVGLAALGVAEAHRAWANCDFIDNTCNGTTDEDFPSLGTACDSLAIDQCPSGVYVCDASGADLVCDELGAGFEEICNEMDDDCDGSIDEGC